MGCFMAKPHIAVAHLTCGLLVGAPISVWAHAAQESDERARDAAVQSAQRENQPAGAARPAVAAAPTAAASPLAADPSSPPIPPYAEGVAIPVEGGGYCYFGPHPVDTRVAAGPAWDESPGRHIHPYPPMDLRLFTYRDGCYHFIGDPSDFGYRGQVYHYYGAHPVQDHYGGGWCFMVGGHAHWWQPWSHHFVVMGPWYYWHGPYDSFFWAYWPYYSFYYRTYYPHYYARGRFFRGRETHVAPPITRVPAPAPAEPWRGMPAAAAGSTAPPGGAGAPAIGNQMGTPAPSPSYPRGHWNSRPSNQNGARPSSPGFRTAPAPSPSFRSAPRPASSAPPAPPSFRGGAAPAPAGGGRAPSWRR
jgi:hypothetical protein